ncbi:YndJ-like protein [Prosthecobacter fusiformis]|uniref:YndJ-like protein n=1 Tax=Prosthecobacter fusiformis TaxID=48464 RepID=A0A4R7S049_9BACT|nr:YndJ family transporter [Prosthecobacter fusiformis]TDU71039.1 YndJ-like protein [Prosthecobacter fusiformis]
MSWGRFIHPALQGALVWLVVMGGWWRPYPQDPVWILGLLFMSIMILMPGSHALQRRHPRFWHSQAEVVCGFLQMTAFFVAPGPLALLMSLPWFIYRAWWAVETLKELLHSSFDPAGWMIGAAGIFPAIGAAWLLANRLNWMPFGFDALIVLLTAAHFHHAGFTLPLMAGLCGKALPGMFSRSACLLILAGVPLVATGITCTHFHLLPWVEPVAVCVLVTGALGVAMLQMRMAFQPRHSVWIQAMFWISGASLLVAMLLALSFGLRSVLPQWTLPMPTMWAVHGSLNTFGFGLCGLLAWSAKQRRSSTALSKGPAQD